MKKCIYCRNLKDKNEFSLEHIIPQFLGGASAPLEYKTRDVCEQCNNILGQFVDASFKKNYLVGTYLSIIASYFINQDNPTLPLICMGTPDLKPPDMDEENEICEVWLGYLGEQVYWIRPKDDDLYWYIGGNPRTINKEESRAYFLFSKNSHKFPHLSWFSFRDAFKKYRRVKKVMCTEVYGANPNSIGFKLPDDIDKKRIDYFNTIGESPEVRPHHFEYYINSDFRFLAKLGIGFAYALFGYKSLTTEYANELYKALWYRKDESFPEIKAKTLFSNDAPDKYKKITGDKNCVTLIIQRVKDSIHLNINIATVLIFNIAIASCENLTQEDLDKVGDGKVIILYEPIQRYVSLDFSEYIDHKSGEMLNKEIHDIELISSECMNFLKNKLNFEYEHD